MKNTNRYSDDEKIVDGGVVDFGDDLLVNRPFYSIQDASEINVYENYSFTNIVCLGDYTLMPQINAYALAVDELRKTFQSNNSDAHPQFTLRDGSLSYRPLTFKENIEARVIEYNKDKNLDGSKRTKDQRLKLFNTWIHSCSGIVYKKNSTLFKIIPKCSELILIPEDCRDPYLKIDYSKIDGVELDSSKEYNTNLSQQQVLLNPAWNAALENDKPLLEEYSEIVFSLLKSSKYQRDSGMGFHIRQNTISDELRALSIGRIDNNYFAYGDNNLYFYARFIRVVPQKSFIKNSI